MLVSDGLSVHVSVCVCVRTREFAHALKEEEKERNIPTSKYLARAPWLTFKPHDYLVFV